MGSPSLETRRGICRFRTRPRTLLAVNSPNEAAPLSRGTLGIRNIRGDTRDARARAPRVIRSPRARGRDLFESGVDATYRPGIFQPRKTACMWRRIRRAKDRARMAQHPR